MKPKYFTNHQDYSQNMLYAAYKDKSYFALEEGWIESIGLTIDYWETHPEYFPCSLTDVNAWFHNIKPHKRISTTETVGTVPA
jgi:hypothetical protein